MSRRRYISTKLSTDKVVNRLAREHGDFIALLWTWMIPHSNDDATIKGDAEELRYDVFPARPDVSDEQVFAALDLMENAGLFELWDREEGLIYYHPSSFYEYQSYIPANKRREPLPRTKRRKTPQNAASLSPSPSLKETRPLSLKGISESVYGVWVEKAGREPDESDLRSLRTLCKNHASQALCTAISQAALQGYPADNFAIITTIARGESA